MGDLGFDSKSRTCTDDDTHSRAAEYDKIQVAIYYPFPLVVVVVSYVLIWRHVRHHFENYQVGIVLQSSTVQASAPSSSPRLNTDDAFVRTTCTSMGSQQCLKRQTGHRLARARNDEMAITKNLFLVVLAFLLFFTPLCIAVVTKSNRFHLYAGMVFYGSCCINPIIYATKHPHFRPVLRSMIRCQCSKATGIS